MWDQKFLISLDVWDGPDYKRQCESCNCRVGEWAALLEESHTQAYARLAGWTGRGGTLEARILVGELSSISI